MRPTRGAPVIAALCLAAATACSGGSPSSPTPGPPAPGSPTPTTPTAPAPAPARPTVVATLTHAVTGQIIGSATQEVDSLPFRIEYALPGYLTRSAWITSTQPTIDLIPDALPFSLDFYRLFVRGGIDGRPLQVIRRWLRAPSVYIKTVDEGGNPMPLAQLDSVEETIRDTAPLYTGGRFGIASFERGTGTREGQSGWITVKWPTENTDPSCGRATVGPDGGYIELLYRRGGGCSCGSLATRPRTVAHELGHSFGYWHTDSTNDLMSHTGVFGCTGAPSERERYHAAIAYGRPAGNRDIDVDPATFSTSSLFRNLPVVVIVD